MRPDHLHRSGARHAGLQQLLRLARRLAPATAVPARLNCGRVGPYLFPPAAHLTKRERLDADGWVLRTDGRLRLAVGDLPRMCSRALKLWLSFSHGGELGSLLRVWGSREHGARRGRGQAMGRRAHSGPSTKLAGSATGPLVPEGGWPACGGHLRTGLESLGFLVKELGNHLGMH